MASQGGGATAGGTAAAVGGMAMAGAQKGAALSARGFVTISAYVQENPCAVKVMCCIMGLALSVLSLFGVIGVIHNEKGWHPKESLQNFYMFFFGLMIFFCDIPQEWANKAFNIQSKLFHYVHFLATQTGRACFYFYVGSITLLMMPDSELWKLLYIILGGTLCLLGIILIALRYCPCGQRTDEQSAAGT
eukprot:gnl/TRDRNA2_/TRDRNA2_80571_c0_seq1.p1 gnl/TRDRNA2_/TRDRNA2_80571_c0~~gnl/TRDRNA2_/TRDRNA2_80571_c0_seq1.p1  ORF type:complete len:206 (-),score=24.47 gnl/TRDRNA2_/TRDRNA2_80571_c0_seq1:70-639(-)